MRRPLESAVIHRDDQLIRTRRLSAWVASGATVASVGLAGVLGAALPGHAATPASHTPTSQPTSGAGQGDSQSGRTGDDHARGARPHRRNLNPPSAPPSAPPTSSAPVVSSGGS